MKFFTDKTVQNDFLLVKLKDYLKLKDYSQWKEILIDPGVYDLMKDSKFKWEGTINISDFLDTLPKNHYFSWDYPGDMNLQYQALFLEKTWKIALKFHKHPQYITTVQYKYNNYWDFIEWFDKYNKLDIASGYLGLGNMCKTSRKKYFMNHALDYAYKNCDHPRIHIYGLPLRFVSQVEKLGKRFKIKTSIDNVKWTFMWYEFDNKEERNNKQLLFNTYLQKIREKSVKLEN